jgi:glycosyltransferase involved in cell wall biosynthesis
MKFIFWFKILSPHQVPYIRALADLGHTVTIVAEAEMSPARRAMGWAVPDLGVVAVQFKPSESEVREVIRLSGKEAVHLIGEIRFEPYGKLILNCLQHNRCRHGIITEAADPRWPLGVVRRGKYLLARYRSGAQFDFILAMGQKGVRWFTQCGYPSSKVFEFAYVVEEFCSVEDQALRVDVEDSTFRLLYVGQLIPRKGVDLLLRALAGMEASFSLEIVGGGPAESTLRALSKQLGVDDRIEWVGSIGSDQVRVRMASADAFVLPSRHDGWGTVVNEALMAGTPTICSDACGASSLIATGACGAIFPDGNVSKLRMTLADRISKGKQSASDRDLLKSKSIVDFGALALAKYFESVIRHVYDDTVRPRYIGGRRCFDS